MKNLLFYLIVILFLGIQVFWVPVKGTAQVSKTHLSEIGLARDLDEGSIHIELYRGIVHVIPADPAAESIRMKTALLNYDAYVSGDFSDDSLDALLIGRQPELNLSRTGNDLSVVNSSTRDLIYMEVAVPSDFSIRISTAHFGKISVRNVNGNLDLSNYSGNIMLVDVGGAVSAQTVRNGSIRAYFESLSPSEPVILTTYDGDIVLNLPAGSAIDLRMKSELGEIISDFRMRKASSPDGEISIREGGEVRQQMTYWIESRLNGGGPLFLLQSIRQNIIIRQNR